MGKFIVARNPLGGSLPYILRVPLNGVDLWLLAKDAWPRSSRVFCWQMPRAPRVDLDIIESVAVRSCTKNGQSVNLLLDRRSRKRSQFIFVLNRGRSQIFWQTARAARAARPGVRIPHAASKNELIYVDSRERYGYTFPHGTSERRTLSAGDYAVVDEDGHVFAAVERKTADDFATSIADASLSFEMLELAALPHAVVVVEASYSTILNHAFTKPGYLPELIARLAIIYPNVPIIFLESRTIAKEWVRRFLHVAHADARAKQLTFHLEDGNPIAGNGAEN
jgi:ERCC4 domain